MKIFYAIIAFSSLLTAFNSYRTYKKDPEGNERAFKISLIIEGIIFLFAIVFLFLPDVAYFHF